MINFKKYFFIFCFSVSFSQSPSFDFSYELKYGDGKSTDSQWNVVDPDYIFNENFFKINSNYKDFYLYLELEYSNSPILGYPKTEAKDVLSKFYLEKQFDSAYVKVGNIYTLYGAGLALYTFPDQNIDFDNSIKGLELKYDLMDELDFFLVSGSSNLEQRTNPAILEPNRFSDNDLNIVGLNYDFSGGYGHVLYRNQKTNMNNTTLQTFIIDEGNRSTLLDWDFAERLDQMIDESGLSESDFWMSLDGDTLTTQSFVLGYGKNTDFGDIYFESEWSEYDKILGDRVSGYRRYLFFGTNIGEVGLSYEYKDYNMPYDLITFTLPPTVAIESSSILAARNSHSMNYGDEVGHQFEIVKPIWGELNFLANLSLSRRHDAKKEIFELSDAGNSAINNYIDNNPFSGNSGEEDDYISEVISESNSLIEQEGNTVENEIHLSSPSFIDYMSFDDSEEYISFYPYRQVYGEISGYLNENLYFKVGYDSYYEVLKHKAWKAYNYNQSDAFNSFYVEAEGIVNAAWQSDFDTCEQLLGFGMDCNGVNDATDYANQEFLDQFDYSSREEYLSSLSFGVSDEYHEIISAWTIPTQLTYNLGSGNSISIYLEYQSKTQSLISGDTDYSDIYFSGSFTLDGLWTVSLFYENENIDYFSGFSKSGYWRGLDLSFDLEDRGQLSIFYGSQKGGRVCANGICADQPGFEDGIKVTYRTFL